ncbi:hypothetical protein ACFQY0_06845 [Haloferula chungangensis]|uniref:Cyclic nucleotide-binding domain-containing protein n=1 Tax=Haloferula chungangensis TaxID=1048331 RepID=A0ABW2L3G8_9BACT
MKDWKSASTTWICGAALLGLALGLACQISFQHLASSPSEAGPLAPPPRTKEAQAPTLPLASGPTSAFLGKVTKLSAAECESMVHDINELQEQDREIELEALFRQWLTFEDADGILAKIYDLKGVWRSEWSLSFFNAWVAVDEQAAMAQTEHNTLNSARALFAIESGRPDFTSYFSALSMGTPFGDRALAALTSLARSRPDIARLIADSSIKDDAKAKFIGAVARGLALEDPESALAWVQAMEFPNKKETYFSIFSEWIRTDVKGAQAAYEQLGLTDLPSSHQPQIASMALRFFAAPDSPLSHANLALHTDPFIDVATLHQKLLDSEVDWGTRRYLSAAINNDGWYGVDPAADAQKAASLPPGEARDFVLTAICLNWAAHDTEAALQFASEQGLESKELQHLRDKPTEAMRQLVSSSPERYFSQLFSTDEPTEMNRDQLHALAMEWGKSDPVKAANWVITQEMPSKDQAASLETYILLDNTLGFNWGYHDPLGASRWVEDLPEAPQRATAWRAMEDYVMRYSPDIAFTMSAVYLEGEVRGNYLKKHLSEVARNIGYPAAFELLKSPDISAAERSVLHESLNTMKGGAKQ